MTFSLRLFISFLLENIEHNFIKLYFVFTWQNIEKLIHFQKANSLF